MKFEAVTVGAAAKLDNARSFRRSTSRRGKALTSPVRIETRGAAIGEEERIVGAVKVGEEGEEDQEQEDGDRDEGHLVSDEDEDEDEDEVEDPILDELIDTMHAVGLRDDEAHAMIERATDEDEHINHEAVVELIAELRLREASKVKVGATTKAGKIRDGRADETSMSAVWPTEEE